MGAINSFMKKFLIVLLLLATIPMSVSAQTVPFYGNILPRLSDSGWTVSGAASVAKNGLTATIEETATKSGTIYTDISVKNTAKSYALLIAYTKAEDVRDNGDITGLPYIYGYFMDKNGKILSYLQKENMRYSGTTDGVWDVSNGVFEMPAGTVKIRYFLKQGSRKGTVKDGRDATFAKPGVYLFDRGVQALDTITEYKNHLPNIWE